MFPFLPFLTATILTLQHPADGQHVVFEEVGQVATSLSYLHVALPLNLTGVSKLVDDYKAALTLEPFASRFPFNIDGDWYQGVFDRRFRDQVIGPAMRDFADVLTELRLRVSMFEEKLKTLLALMPTVTTAASNSYETDDLEDRKRRRRRAAPFLVPLLLKGVFGTFHGLYNRHKYSVLKKELNTVIRNQNRLITTSRDHDEALLNLKLEGSQVRGFLGNLTVFAPVLIISKLLNMEMLIEDEIDRVWDAVQVAQQHRLSIRLIPAHKMAKLFGKIKRKAESTGNELLLDRSSDLYQIELSYCHDGEDIALVLHVPMAPKSTTLRLLKFLPFPFSLSSKHFLMPQPTRRLLAISSDEPRLSMEFTEADLEGCHRVNNIYLCERQGTLMNRMDLTCLGALYGQRFRSAAELCDMKARPITEQVLQLNDNWFLVYAVQQFTAYITCRNATSSEHHFQVGVNKITVSPTCKVKLQDHVLYADTSLKDTNAIIQFTFNLQDTPLASTEFDDVETTLEELAQEGETDPTLDDLRRSRSLHRRYPKWIWFNVLCSIVLVVVLIFVAYGACTSTSWMYMRYTLKRLSDTVWPTPNPHAIYDNTKPPFFRHAPAFARRAAEVADELAANERALAIEQLSVRQPMAFEHHVVRQPIDRGVPVDVIPPPAPPRERDRRSHSAPRMGASTLDFVRTASRRLRGHVYRGSQPEDLPAPFRRQRLPYM